MARDHWEKLGCIRDTRNKKFYLLLLGRHGNPHLQVGLSLRLRGAGRCRARQWGAACGKGTRRSAREPRWPYYYYSPTSCLLLVDSPRTQGGQLVVCPVTWRAGRVQNLRGEGGDELQREPILCASAAGVGAGPALGPGASGGVTLGDASGTSTSAWHAPGGLRLAGRPAPASCPERARRGPLHHLPKGGDSGAGGAEAQSH
mmetsp:Transcript_24154/g.71129  ORF Transcript_24154/g.71129 Transcript_24154/m.71129 type:complete len:202 (+) Transcript_24154:230-835(+)